MEISLDASVSIFTVFIQGLLSFFSPCVLPLIPVYIGYLSGGTLSKDENGHTHYNRKKVFINTVFFVIGISFAFFLLGLGMSTIGRFFSSNQLIFARIGGAIVILFGIYQLGIFKNSNFLESDHRLPFDIDKMTMSPLTAIIMGFVLSFAWTPCVGPTLSSVLIMAASTSSYSAGFLLIGVYTLGYIIPFLLVGLFSTSLLEFFAKHRAIVKYTAKIGGILLIFMGLLMLSGKLNNISSYLANISINKDSAAVENSVDETINDIIESEEDNSADNTNDNNDTEDEITEQENEKIAAPDFSLTDQYGNVHALSDYHGKIVFLNFWATWCPPCREEMPYIQELYEEYATQDDPEVVFLSVAFPEYGQETDEEGIKDFLDENGYTYPVLMDYGATLALPYYITAYPTTFLIDKEGYVLGYIPGGMDKATMEDVIAQAKELSN